MEKELFENQFVVLIFVKVLNDTLDKDQLRYFSLENYIEIM